VPARKNEFERVAALRAMPLLDTLPEERFDRITRLAQHLFDVPMAMVSLVDADRQWAKSRVGDIPQESARELSFCSYAVDTGQPLYVPDAAADPRFAGNPAVTGAPHIRFYAGWPFAAPSGHLVGTLCVLDRVPRWLTARQRQELGELAAWVELECAVVQVNQWEQAAERARRDFVSMVSHELRTPLTSIHGSLELIASGRFGDVPPQVGKLVGIAVRNTDRLVRLSQDVVDLHQMVRGQLRLRLDDVALPDIVEQAADAVRDVAEHAAIPVDVICDEPATVRGDADRLVQVVTNLLVNAVRVSPPGETVTVRCGMDGARAQLEVRDHGPGVPQGQLDEIFEPFVQFELPGQRRTGGAGLGLAIARGIVEAHGGRIGAQPAIGGGSTFAVSLPAAGPNIDRAWW
jgi:signal transduction histidine kinase